MHCCDLCHEGVGIVRVGPSVREVEYLDGAIHCDDCTTTLCSLCAFTHDSQGCAAFWTDREALRA